VYTVWLCVAVLYRVMRITDDVYGNVLTYTGAFWGDGLDVYGIIVEFRYYIGYYNVHICY